LKHPLVLSTDVYGGRGGIAQYNRLLIKALCEISEIEEITVIPRKIFYDLQKIPSKVIFKKEASNSILNYVIFFFRLLFKKQTHDIIFCNHIHLLPFAWLLKLKYKCKLVLIIYGEEAWKPTKYQLANFLSKKINYLISIRYYTTKKFIKWSKFKIKKNNYFYLPNCIEHNEYGFKLKNKILLKKYNKNQIIISCARLDIEDRFKGVDEILEILQDLSKKIKDLIYIVIGDGDDYKRLKEKANLLNVENLVIFTGYLSKKEKIDYLRLGNLMAMPGSRKSFDRYPFRFVFLEALASGMQVICPNFQNKSEINDPNTKMLIQVNPLNRKEMVDKIVKAIKKKKYIHPLLKNFYFSNFKVKIAKLLNKIESNV
jgi:phosphatidylinositol alpha-1,6-mannosyltransferase